MPQPCAFASLPLSVMPSLFHFGDESASDTHSVTLWSNSHCGQTLTVVDSLTVVKLSLWSILSLWSTLTVVKLSLWSNLTRERRVVIHK